MYYLLVLFFILVLSGFLSFKLKNESINLFTKLTLVLSIFLILLEIGLSLHFRLNNDYWIFNLVRNPNSELFEPHPYLVVSNKKNVNQQFSKVRIKHNSKGYRGDEIPLKTYIIAAIGGSTTYGVGVNNLDTWPAKLDSLAGPDTTVVNLGIPGHTTIEHLVTTSLHLNDLQPDMILLHTGLNDLRMSNVRNIESDYSNFHAPHMVGSMGLCYLEPLPHIASLYYTVLLMQKLGYYPICSFHSNSAQARTIGGLDQEALSLYRENLKKLIHNCKYYTGDIILIPQVLNRERIKGDGLKWWIPFVEEKQLIPVLNRYNQVTKEVADSSNCIYLDKIDEIDWLEDDFTDPSHLNAVGNNKFAGVIYSKIKKRKDSLTN